MANCRLEDLIDVNLACEVANSKLVDVVTVAEDEGRVGNSLLQIWKLRFGHKAKLLFRLWAQALVNILEVEVEARFLKFGQYFEIEVQARSVWSVFSRWGFVKVMKSNIDQDSEASFGQYFQF